jgi:putative ABC transport system ATP-binding protein
MSMKLINVVQQYGQQKVVDIKYWEVNAGEQWLLRGNSGSGKTTLLHLMAGLLKPTSGEIYVQNTLLNSLKNNQLDHFRGQYIGIVFQQPYLIKTLNAIDNLKIANLMAGKKVTSAVLLQLLDNLNIAHLQKKYPHQLSTGEAQRLCIARALANSPALLLADEPTAALDDQNARQVAELLQKQATESQTALVIATHDSRLENYFQLIKRIGG